MLLLSGALYVLAMVPSQRSAGLPADRAIRASAPAETSARLASVHDVAGQLSCRSEFFTVQGRPAFILLPEKPAGSGMPWVWYAPTLENYPNKTHRWMFQQFLEHGIAVAGVDIGESYGSPAGRATFTAFYQQLRREHSFAEKACLLPQSRGGLMLYNWAAENPQWVACIAGIYPVCDLRSYPGLVKASGAYGTDARTLAAELSKHNPIDRLQPLSRADVPVLHVHGDNDRIVPLERNSKELAARYRALGAPMRLIVVPGKGHEEVPEFFRCQELTDFVIGSAGIARKAGEAGLPPERIGTSKGCR